MGQNHGPLRQTLKRRKPWAGPGRAGTRRPMGASDGGLRYGCRARVQDGARAWRATTGGERHQLWRGGGGGGGWWWCGKGSGVQGEGRVGGGSREHP